MKTLLALLIACALFSACTKDDQTCKSCTFVIANAEEYPYEVSFFNWPGSPAPFTLQPGDVKNFQAPAHFSISIVGDYKSQFAHNDYKKSFYCPGDCGAVSVVLKQ